MSKTEIVAEKGTQDIVISRIFKAPRELVFATYNDPATVPDWWGPRKYATTVEQMDVKKGGVWRYIQRDADGREFAFYGVYHEVLFPERLINTFEFEGFPGQVGLVTTTFEELPDGRTKLVEKSVYPSMEARDGIMQSGMSEGAIELMDRLEELLEKLQT